MAKSKSLPYAQLPRRASLRGQNDGAVARAAVDNAVLTVRDTVSNTVVPTVKAGALYVGGFVRNFFASK
jgi:hypothetical protein